MGDESEYAARWDEVLERIGKDAVVTRLGIKAASGTGPGASFRLWNPQLPDPSRGYVEEWLRRKTAEAEATAAKAATEAKATETKRFRTNVWLTVALAVVGIIAAILIAAWFR